MGPGPSDPHPHWCGHVTGQRHSTSRSWQEPATVLLVVASSQTVLCWAGPGAQGSMQTMHRAPCRPHTEEHPGTAPAGSARWGLRDDMGRGLPGAFKASSNPPVPFQDAWEEDRQRGCTPELLAPMHPRTPCPGGVAEAWRVGPACQPLHLPLVSQVRLVAHQHDDNVAAPLRPDVIDPLRGLLEGVEVWRWKGG